jgi:lipopolysaccharide export system ATP-binding protein
VAQIQKSNADASAPVLAAFDLVVRLGGAEILRGVSIELRPGEILGVLGPSGAGKSTLFRALAGELRADSGRIELFRNDVTDQPLWRRARGGLGYVPQTPSVIFDLTIADNIRTFERAARVERKPPEERAALVDLSARLDVRAGELSGGERRRLELLRALIAKPEALILDEPLSGVDPAGAHRMGRLLRDSAESGMAILIADHRVHEALEFCDRAALLVDGRIDLEAEPAAFLDHPAVRRRYLG